MSGYISYETTRHVVVTGSELLDDNRMRSTLRDTDGLTVIVVSEQEDAPQLGDHGNVTVAWTLKPQH